MTKKEFNAFLKNKAELARLEKEVKAQQADAMAYFMEHHANDNPFFDMGEYKIKYCEGAIVETVDSKAVQAFYLQHHDSLPKVESIRAATFKAYLNK